MDKNQINESLEFIYKENKVIDERSKKRILVNVSSPKPKKRKTVFIPAIVMIFLLIGSGVLISSVLPTKEQNTGIVTEQEENPTKMDTENQNKIGELEFEKSQLEVQNDYYRNAIDQLMANLNDEEMLQFAKNQFSYEMRVNEEVLPSNGHMTMEPGEVLIMLSFKMPPVNILSEEWQQKGMLSGNYYDHIEHVEPAGWEDTYADGTTVTARGFKYVDMKSGDEITLTITDDLKERLQLQTSKIIITVQ